MKRTNYFLISLFVVISVFSSIITYSQTRTVTDGKYSYQVVDGDPLKARIYKLDNGLTVYMTVYKNEPRIQTNIAVKAGSKNDPSDATGLAHYLEHMLFKGTDKYGTKDFASEKPLLDKIVELYEVYNKTTDEIERKNIYKQIDSVSNLASKFAIANEYDKMLSSIGAKGTNAYTSNEQTVYVNDIPSNQLEKWLTIEAERFRNPVMRLYHTELEVVYEEKNISLDEDGSKLWESLFYSLFPKHQYGQQTTIGTIEHLKNPSLKKTIEYLHTYYVPNNMAICLSGDLDMDETIKMIDEKWGSMQPKPVPEYIPPVEEPIKGPVVKEVFGKDAEELMLAFRFNGVSSVDPDMLSILDNILSNSNTGLIDMNLIQGQKVLEASSFPQVFKDYSAHIFSGKPRNGQTLEEVKNLLLSQIEEIKKGNFEDWMLPAIINNMKYSQMTSFENNRRRAGAFVNAFVQGKDWEKQIKYIDRLSKITKQQIVDFANENYKDNYVVVYKRQGEDKDVKKVEKPEITPVDVNRADQSEFLKNIVSTPAPDIQPVFLNYKKEIQQLNLKNNTKVFYKQNSENSTFVLYYKINIGDDNDKRLGLAASYFSYLGSSQYSPEKLKQEFYKLACDFSMSASNDEVTFALSGLSDNFEKALVLFEDYLNDIKPNTEVLGNLVNDILKVRTDNKVDKNIILWEGLSNFAKYGPKSSFTNILTEAELKKVTPEELIKLIKTFLNYEHEVIFYGPQSANEVVSTLNKYHVKEINPKPVPAIVEYPEKNIDESVVYFANYDGMVQAEIVFMSRINAYKKDWVPYIAMFNEYFGSGMSGIVFQELRESKALAYSTYARFTNPPEKKYSHYMFAYIGTQVDKLSLAMTGLTDLLENLPESENTFSSAKNSIINQINTTRITKAAVIFDYLNATKLGIDYDIRQDIYNKIPSISLNDIKIFHDEQIKGRKYAVLVLGDKKKIDFKILEKYGKVQELILEQLFGY